MASWLRTATVALSTVLASIALAGAARAAEAPVRLAVAFADGARLGAPAAIAAELRVDPPASRRR